MNSSPLVTATAASVLLSWFLTGAAAAQVQPFPMRATSHAEQQVRLRPVPGRFAALASLDDVVLTGVPVPGEGELALELRRVPIHLRAGALHVDGAPARNGIDPSLSLWSGRVLGQPGSQAFLAFSDHGSRGWFGRAGNLYHLLAEPGANNDWSGSRLVTEQFVAAARFPAKGACQMLTPTGAGVQRMSQQRPLSGDPLPYYDAPIAFETDYEFFKLFNNMAAAQAYAFALIGAVSDRYREQVGVIFTLPYVGFHSKNTDPWTETDCLLRLLQFKNAWANGKAPKRAALYHMISGVKVIGCSGAAFLNVVCDQTFGFGMSAHINARLTFPPVQGPLTWDFYLLAHELGHNFGSVHTHDYKPPIDRCNVNVCPGPTGTNMSYCSQCPGGMRNITLRFHPRVVPSLRAGATNSCLKPYDGVITKDLGKSLLGSNGTPLQLVTFSKPTLRTSVSKAPKSTAGILFLGFKQANRPFLGGTLVPSPDIALQLTTSSAGNASFAIPATGSYRSGVTFFLHSWFLDQSGPNGFAASNATRVELIRP